MSIANFDISKIDYCWERIGIAAEVPSCPKLAEAIHCRNCEEFQSKSALLLELEPEKKYLEEWADFLSAEKTDSAESKESVFIFRLGVEWLAVPTRSLKEVSKPSVIHKVPGKSDEFFLGLVNIRGSLKLCFSLKKFIGIDDAAEKERDEHNLFGERLITLDKGGQSWVFPVDEVLDIYKYDERSAGNVPSSLSNAAASYTKKIFKLDSKMIGFLDDELIISALKRRIS